MGKDLPFSDLLKESELQKLQSQKMPDPISPMLATLTHKYFDHQDWVFERKLDGERAIAYLDGNNVDLKSRNQQNLNANYPEIIDALQKYSRSMVLDGEIVAFDQNLTSFEKLQSRMHRSSGEEGAKVKIYYYIFDIIYYQPYLLNRIKLRDRKKILKKAIDFQGLIRYTLHRNREGKAFYRQACQKGWEGVMAKNGDSNYKFKRSRDWLKFKCSHNQEFVVVGYTPPQGSRKGFGALLLGYYQDQKLTYAGKVGTGFSQEELEWLTQKMKDLKISHSPLETDRPSHSESIQWLQPTLVIQVSFSQWTKNDKLRHPRFKGLREDKSPQEVVRES